MCRGVRLFSALRVLNRMQDFIALADSRSSLLLARKAHRVVEVADDPTILEVQFRREIKRNRHAAETSGCVRGSPKIARGVMMGLRELRAKFLRTFSHKRSGLCSPALARSMMRRAMISLARSPRSERRSAVQTISNATPMTRLVSGLNDIPLR